MKKHIVGILFLSSFCFAQGNSDESIPTDSTEQVVDETSIDSTSSTNQSGRYIFYSDGKYSRWVDTAEGVVYHKKYQSPERNFKGQIIKPSKTTYWKDSIEKFKSEYELQMEKMKLKKEFEKEKRALQEKFQIE